MPQQFAPARPLAAPLVDSAPSLPFISVIVPVRNEGGFIADTLAQLFAQEYSPSRFEVLVADGGSTDDTPAILAALASQHTNLRLLPNPRGWSSAGRNVAARAARGDVVLLVDGHCEIDNPQYLSNLATAFQQSGADCVGRPQPLDVTGATPLQRAIAAARASRLGHHPASHIYSDREGFVPPESVAVAYRREVFETIGHFDETFDACEDVEFNHRAAQAGLTCYFTPGIQVRYHPRNSLPKLFRQMVRYGRGRIRLLRKHPDTFSLPGFVPAAFLAGLILGPVLALMLPVLGLVYAGTLAFYALLLAIASVRITWRHREPAMLALLPLVFVTVHLGAGTGLWWEILARRRISRTPVAATGPDVGSEPAGKRGRLPLRQAPVAATGPVAGSEPAGKRDRVPLRQAAKGYNVDILPFPTAAEPATATRILNALTIDVEDYFHVSGFDHCVDRSRWEEFAPRVQDSTQRMLDCLAEADVRATFFILGWVAERQPGLVKAIHAAGHEIGCHSYGHRLIYQQTPAEFRADLRRGLAVLQDIVGEPVTTYRAPSFSITQQSLWALDILIEEGIRLDSSIYPTHHDRYGIPGTPLGPHRIDREPGSLWEFPPPVWQCLGYPLPVGGGGYFRLYPYTLTRLGLSRINASGRPFAAYLHPWELDPEQPRLRPGRMRAFRHYVGLSRTEKRLKHMLRDFRFGTLSEAMASVEPSAKVDAPVLPLRLAA